MSMACRRYTGSYRKCVNHWLENEVHVCEVNQVHAYVCQCVRTCVKCVVTPTHPGKFHGFNMKYAHTILCLSYCFRFTQ